MAFGPSTAPGIYIDARVLQDPVQRSGGVASHIASLLRGRHQSKARNWPVVGLIDDRLGMMPETFAGLFDHLSNVLNPVLPLSGSVFIHPSPMTYDTRFTSRFARHPNLVTTAIVDDSVLPGSHGDPSTVAVRIINLSRLARLRKCDIFMTVSRYAAFRLQQMLGIPETRISLTGAAVRSSLLQAVHCRSACLSQDGRSRETFFLVVGCLPGTDDIEVAVRAVQRIRAASGQQANLKIASRYRAGEPAVVCSARHNLEGASFITFFDDVDDDTLARLYADSVATIIPTNIQGFPLPVIEACMSYSPVVALRCPASEEVIDQPEALFTPNDDRDLAEKLLALLNNAPSRSALLKSQAPVRDQFTEGNVSARFWDSIVNYTAGRFSVQAASIARRQKPRIAILSPFPPDHSGCAWFTERTIEAGRKSFEIDLFTNAPRPLYRSEAFRDAGLVNIGVFGGRPYDAVLSVIGNSPYHNGVFDFFERFGGPCILHDSRLTQVYHYRLGRDRFIRFAESILGRAVSQSEVDAWLEDRDLPTYFVEPIIGRAAPLIVHTRVYQRLLKQRYGFDSQVATFPPSHTFAEAEITQESRQTVRKRRSLDANVFVIASFGHVHRSKSVAEAIKALSLLRSWGIPAELHFVGALYEPEEDLLSIVREAGVNHFVHFTKEFVDEATYRDFLIASDAAIALRTYAFGQPSAGLVDCIAAGLPSVASAPLAEACESPSYVKTIEEDNSPLLMAKQLAAIREASKTRDAWRDERMEYLRTHSFELYIQRLHEILGL